ncbi:hypothetical protein MM817_01694 [Acidibacillus sp. S0AB]|uniref:Big-1 domain-containing protein n=2 Tax=Sulfoacidibacillus ferrooxidans TaxID=2005001 RepID=A0A9X2AEJ7_9BACL|nr:hypothetical protein [Sulfoacidibacillus ferrooxidans]
MLQATVTDMNGNAVANVPVTFTVTGSTVNGANDYTASTMFSNGQSSDTVTTDSQGMAVVPLSLTLTPSSGSSSLSAQEIDPNAATLVNYSVTANGVTSNNSVGFATFQPGTVTVANASSNVISPATTESTDWMYPYGNANQTVAGNYATANEVSPSGTLDQSLNVTTGYALTVPEQTSDSNQSGAKTIPLSGGVNSLQPNETNVYTDATGKMAIPGDVNYATLNFSSLGLSTGSIATVYFVPTGGAAPTTVKSSTQGVTSLNGTTITSWPLASDASTGLAATLPDSGPQVWAKSFIATSSNLSDSNFGVQIPTNGASGTVYVVLQTPGQIDPVADSGYSLSSIVMNYASTSGSASFVNVPLSSDVTWSQVPMQYTNWQPLNSGDVSALQNTSVFTQSTQGMDTSAWTYQYEVPVYPQVGDAVIQALANGVVQKEWNAATTNNGSNQNQLVVNSTSNEITGLVPVTSNATTTTPSTDTLTQSDGVATINATQTGPQEIEGTLSLTNFPQNLVNSLASTVYASAQWTPLPSTTAVAGSTIANNQYALTGQDVTVTATVEDVNGNPVETAGIPVTFTVNTSSSVSVTPSGQQSQTLTNGVSAAASAYKGLNTYVVPTNTNGTATLTLSSAVASASVVQATANVDGTNYQVALSTPAGALNDSSGLTAINFGQVSMDYVPENGDSSFTPEMNPIASSSVVVNNGQNFGLLPSVTWPSESTIEVSPITATGKQIAYGATNGTPFVNGLPFDVTTASGSVGTVNQTQTTATTNTTSAGLTQWTALSTKAGQETIDVNPSTTSSSWSQLALEHSLTSTPVVDAGTGLPSGVNSLTIPVQWTPGVASASVSVPSTNAAVGTTVPIYVSVMDAEGNPISGATVNFGLTTSTGGSASLSATSATTNSNGMASVTLSGGVNSETDQVTITATQDGASIPVAGQTTDQVNINWSTVATTFSPTTVIPNLVSSPNTITLTFTGAVDASSLNPGEFTVSSSGQTYTVQSAQVSSTNADQVILTLASNSPALPSSGFSVSMSPYTDSNGIQYQVSNNNDQTVAANTAVNYSGTGDLTSGGSYTVAGSGAQTVNLGTASDETGSYTIYAPNASSLTLSGNAADVTIDAPNAAVTNYATISGTLTLADPVSFTNGTSGVVGILTDTQSSGLMITNDGSSGSIGSVVIAPTSGKPAVTLEGSYLPLITVEDAVALTVPSGTSVANSSGSSITVNGGELSTSTVATAGSVSATNSTVILPSSQVNPGSSFNVTGVIEDAFGNPIPNATVVVSFGGSGGSSTSVTTDSTGNYSATLSTTASSVTGPVSVVASSGGTSGTTISTSSDVVNLY